ncbi:MAG: NAD-dependent dihydropyrimidine dehydrogenase subunit PreA [Oscillospiraceae bacterium]|jgi:dihydropyrimidine dehydrogenase (NAD+) subunit PreA|nr:NAD-dependent dihydropyrimidine dehydrogenase subunit PreA [Oscillospiraceae bacterium]
MKELLGVNFCGFPCENPFLLSSSCVSANYDMCARAFEMGWAGVVFKTIGRFEVEEPSPRFAMLRSTPNSLLGLKNLEQHWEAHPIEEDFEAIARLKRRYPEKLVVSSIIGVTPDEWTDMARLSEQAGADMLELNFSCPHTSNKAQAGAAVGEDPDLVKAYCAAARRGTRLPMLAKMTANATHMEIPALAALEGGADGIAAINTINCIIGVDLDTLVGAPDIQGLSAPGGYSGVGVRPIAMRFIQELASHPGLRGVPLSATGGAETWRDCAEFLTMGAATVQVTTAVMHYGYRIIENLLSGLSCYLEEKGTTAEALIGAGLPYMVEPDDLTRGVNVYPVFRPDVCVGCGRCYLSCRDGGHQALAWDSRKRLPSVIPGKCAACHLCTEVCPVGAIAVCQKP